MAQEFSGTVRLRKRRARLERARGNSLLLIPFTKELDLDQEEKIAAGGKIFGFLKNRTARVIGELDGDVLYSASLKDVGKPDSYVPIDQKEFAEKIETVFQSDTERIVRRLSALEISNLAAFYHRVTHSEPEVGVFAEYLEVPKKAVHDFVDSMQAEAQQSLISSPPMMPVKRGVNVAKLAAVTGDRVKGKAPNQPPVLPGFEHTPHLPSRIDLRRLLCITKVRDQRLRSTCVAHTVAAMTEAEMIRLSRLQGKAAGRKPKLNRSLDLSEQYLYWACKQVDGAPDQEGTFIEYGAQVMRKGLPSEKLPAGVPPETAWRYTGAPQPGNESQGPAPDAARAAAKHSATRAMKVDCQSPRAIKEVLARGHCVGLSVYTYHFWTDGYAWREGSISLPLRIPIDGAHAICLVGFEDRDQDHGDGHFLFKNSWGTTWGAARKDPGFGSLPYRYVLEEGIEAWTLVV